MPSNENYEDDFEDSNNLKFQDKKSIEFPKINNKNLSKSKSINKLLNNSQIDNQNYQQDFQPQNAKSNKKKLNLNSNQQNINKTKKSTSTLNAINSLKKRQNSNKKLSLGDLKNSNVQSEPKYISYLNNQFSHTREQIMQLQPEKINRLNQKLKSYIKKVNDDLTELINQNMRKLQANNIKTTTENKTVEDEIRILTEQKKSGDVFLENVQRQCQSLKEKWQKIKDQKLNRNMDQQISQTNLKIKEILKQITLLKHNVSHQGNKLTEEQNYVEILNELKTKISNLTKDEERNTERIYKNQAQFEEFSEKNPHIELLLQEMVQKAKNQSIKINPTQQDKKLKEKFEELKKKLQIQKAHIDKTESLNETKANILKRDNEIIKNQATQVEKKSAQIDSQMASIKQSSLSLIQQAKNQDLQTYIQTHLDFISKNISEGNAYSLGTGKIQKKNSSKNLSEEGQKNNLKKHGSVANVGKYERTSSDVELKPNFQIPKKSTFDEKKEKNNLKLKNQNHSSQRVWKEDQNGQKQKPKHMSESNNSSKPFIIRKSKNVPSLNDGKPKELKLDHSVGKNDEKQNQKSALLGPKKKFKKTEHHEPEVQNQRKNQIISEQSSNELKIPKKDQETTTPKSPFKIKKTVKQKVEIPDEDLYVLGQVPKKDGQENSPTDQLQNKKGSNFKFFRKPQSDSKQSPRQQSSIQEQIPANKEEANGEDPEINVGRRQAGRKIQRKEEVLYGS